MKVIPGHKYSKDKLISTAYRLVDVIPSTVDSLTRAYMKLNLVVVFIIDGGEAEITTGEKGHVQMPFDGKIVSVSLLANQSGSIVIDIWKDTYANFLPTNADSITASAPPTISTATKSEDTTLTDWTKTFAEGDVLAFNVDSITDIERVTVTLVVRRT